MSVGFSKVAKRRDLAPGQMLRVNFAGEPVLLVNLNGDYHAVSDTCSHEDASLFKGALVDDCVRCPLHGSRFHFKTGKAMEEPADQPITVYPVELVGDDILIGPPAADLAT